MKDLSRKLTMLAILYFCTIKLIAQDIYYIHSNSTNDGYVISRINPTNCQITHVVNVAPPLDALSQNFSDITFDTKGNLYILDTKVTPSSKGVSKIDTLTGICSRIVSFPSGFAFNSLTCSSDDILYFGANNVFSFNLSTNELINIGGPLPVPLAGDLTFRNGKLLGAGFPDKIIEINTSDPTQSNILFSYTTDPNFFALGIVSYAPSCDSTITYTTANENVSMFATGKLYQLDFNTQSTIFLCDLPYGALGAAIKNEFNASFCGVELNLDPDTSSFAPPTDYMPVPVCLPIQIMLADTTDALLRSGYHIDSVHVQLLSTSLVTADELISPLNWPLPGLQMSMPDNRNAWFYNTPGSSSGSNSDVFNQLLQQMTWKGTTGFGPRTVQWVVYASGGRTDTAYTYFNIFPPNNAGTDNSLALCNNALPQTLAASLLGNADPNGTWFPSNTYQPLLDDPGAYAYVVNNGLCPADTAVVQIIENQAPVFTLGPDLYVCTAQTQTLAPPQSVGLSYVWSTGILADSLLVNAAGLYWAEAIDLQGCRWVDTLLVSPADTFRVQVQVSTCVGQPINWQGFVLYSDTSFCVTYTSLRGCDSIQCISASFYYPTLQLDTSICQGRALDWQNKSLDAPGVYRDTFLVAGCQTDVQLTLSLTPPDTLQENAVFCTGSYLWYGDTLKQAGRYERLLQIQGVCDLAIKLDLMQEPALLSNLNQTICAGSSIEFGSKTLLQSGIYTDTLRGFAGACDTIVTLQLQVQALPVPQILGDTVLCAGQQTSLEVAPGFTTYTWSNGANSNKINAIGSGTYSITVTDALGCMGADSFKVEVLTPLSASWSVVDPSCPGFSDGAIWLQQVTGGRAPYQYRLNGGTGQTQTSFTLLPAGAYTLEVSDQFGCTVSENIDLQDPAVWSVDLGPDVALAAGATYLLPLVLQGSATPPLQYAWSPTAGLSCSTCPQPVAQMQQTTTYQVTVSDGAGCTQTDTVTLRLRDSIVVYLPNIFHPDGTDGNRVFNVFSRSGSEVRIQLFQIFDRWGSNVYEKRNFLPSDQDGGWDGRINGKDALPGVYVWTLLLTLPDGTVVERQGAVTLYR